MNKNYLVLIIATMMLFSMGSAYAALGVGSWIENNNNALSITVGQTAEFRYGVTAVTSMNGKYSIMLYREGNTNPLATYFNNQVTIGNGAIGKINVTPANYGNVAGNYYVMIYSSDNYGSHSYKLNLAVAASQPTAIAVSCNVNPSNGYSPLNTQFTSTVTGGTGTYTYTWTFGDGTTSNTKTATSHTYTTAGAYTTSLSIKDSANTVATANCGQVTVNAVTPPNTLKTSCVASPLTGTAPVTIGITSQTSGGTAPYTYEWTYGDGSVTTNNYKTILAYTYTKAGIYATSLKVTDANNNVAQANCGIINVAAAIAPLNATCTVTPTSGNAPLNVQVNAQATGGSEIYTYNFIFGDNQNALILSTTDKNTTYSHTYTNANTYSASLQVVDSASRTITVNCGQVVVNTVVIPQLNVTCNANPTSGTAPLDVEFTSTVTGGTGTYTYNWVYGDGATASNQNTATHTYTTAGTYNPTLTITDSNNNIATANCNNNNGIIVATPILNVQDIMCFPRITDGSNQSCSVIVESNNGLVAGNVNVNIYYINGTLFGTCTTNSISGACEVENVVNGVGTKTVYATANAQGYINDTNTQPIFQFEVYEQRYNIINLGTYSDINFSYSEDTFYRGQPIYAKFQVYDPEGNTFVTNDIVTTASLVSLPGGRVDLNRMNYSDNWYYYELNSIPLNHYFLGDSNVFAFAFNFTGLTSGQAQINLTILNNMPTINNIADVYITVGNNEILSLNNYATDLEDQILTWNILSNSSLFSTNIDTNNMLTITGLVEGTETLILRAYDLDNDFAETNINVHIIPGTNTFNLTSTCDANPTNGTNPLEVEFTTTTIGGIGPYTYIWTYDDGQVGIDSDATNHTYNTGTYSPTVTIIDSINNRATARCGRITVTDNNVTPTNMTVSCFAMPDSGTAPLTVLLNTVVSNGAAPYTFTYDYGNGTTSTNQNNLRVIIYDTTGIYNPTVEVTDNNGVVGTASCGIVMVGDNNGTNILTANTGGPYISYINEALTFNASLSNGNIVRYSWDFGDGTIVDSVTPEVQHIYTKIDRYNVVLTVYGIYGNSNSASTIVTVVERTAPKIEDKDASRNLPDKGIVVKSLTLFGKNGGDTLGSNDYLSAKINVKNEWDSKLKNVRITLSIPELGLEARSSTFDFSRGSEHSETIVLPLYDVAPGAYYVKVEIHNNQGGDEVRRIKYREIIVE